MRYFFSIPSKCIINEKTYIYIILGLSIFTNIAVLFFFLKDNHYAKENSSHKEELTLSDYSTRQKAAETIVKKLVCENLYYPNSYDPVKTQVDSVFYNYMLDETCVNAASKLIDLQKSYESAKETYEQNDWTIRFHGNPKGTFLERERKERAEASKSMKFYSEKIAQQKVIIRNRDYSKDGSFVGWQVIHRYRASNSNGVVSFGNILYILNPQMNKCYFSYSLDDNDSKNLKAIKKTIEEVLGI